MSGPQLLSAYAKSGMPSAAVVWAVDQGARAIMETPRGVHWMRRDLLDGPPGDDVVELLSATIRWEPQDIPVTRLSEQRDIQWAQRMLVYLVSRIVPSAFVAWAERYLEVQRVLDMLGEIGTPANGWGTLGNLVHTGKGRWELVARGSGTGRPFEAPAPPAGRHTLWIADGLLHDQPTPMEVR